MKPISQLQRTLCAAPRPGPLRRLSERFLGSRPGLPPPGCRRPGRWRRGRTWGPATAPRAARRSPGGSQAPPAPKPPPERPKPPPAVAQSNRQRHPAPGTISTLKIARAIPPRSTSTPAPSTRNQTPPTPQASTSQPAEEQQKMAAAGRRWPTARTTYGPEAARGSGGSSPRMSTASHRRGDQRAPSIGRRRVATGANHPASRSSAFRRGPGTPAVMLRRGTRASI